MHRLLAEHIGPSVGDGALRHDGAVVDVVRDGGRLAVTTDSFVVTPLFFPGGDIGKLAVYGTVNDLVATGAEPRVLTLGLILEEGLPLATLDRVLASIRSAADEAGVRVATGDTKVVERGKGDGVFINTTGLGEVPSSVEIGAWKVREGDAVLVSGDVGRHGMAVLSVRESLGFATPIESDCGSLLPNWRALQAANVVPSCMRDCTRGGLAASVVEIGGAADVDIVLDEGSIPVDPGVRAACEILGLDAVHLACEGRMVVFARAEDADTALAALKSVEPSAARIGTVTEGTGRVWLRDAYGGERLLDLPLGEALPRIC
ncbi:MAG: hydrogenase expression/formation protein HypE [Deltaproteobacteria bacterium]|nr:MAG: hydrogenase expression/formation protein HypE [Deltaproteobacteria bacterium]